jgi:hypothetical protein
MVNIRELVVGAVPLRVFGMHTTAGWISANLILA